MKLNKEIELNLKLKLISVFNPAERLDELGEIPKLPNGLIDYWQAGKLLCEKDGGRMPTCEELQLISAADRAGLIDTGLDQDKWFWSSTEDSSYPQYNARIVDFNDGYRSTYDKGNYGSYFAVLCVGK